MADVMGERRPERHATRKRTACAGLVRAVRAQLSAALYAVHVQFAFFSSSFFFCTVEFVNTYSVGAVLFSASFPFKLPIPVSPARAAASLREKRAKSQRRLRQPLARAAALVSRACLRCLERGRTARRGRAARAGRAGTPPPVSVAGLWRGGHVCGDVSIGTSLLHTLDHTRYHDKRGT